MDSGQCAHLDARFRGHDEVEPAPLIVSGDRSLLGARYPRERGVALLMVLGLLTLLGAVVAEFQYNSRVDFKLAVNARDGLQAEANALSALRFRSIILKQAGRVDRMVRGLSGSFGGAVPPLGQLLQMIPVECGLMSAITVKANRLEGDEHVDFFPGECLATSESETSKIRVQLLYNMLQSGRRNDASTVAMELYGLLVRPEFLRHFEEDDRNGTHAESPEELVATLKDWMDADKNETGNNLADEDRHYVYLDDSYKAKNAPLDSVAELQLVHGIDDELYDLLKNRVTIYPQRAALELSTLSLDGLLLALLSILKEGSTAENLLAHPGFTELFITLQTQQLMGVGAGVNKVTELRQLLQQVGLDSLLDLRRLAEVLTDDQGTTWFTINAEGRVGDASRRVKAVLQTQEGLYYYRVE